MKPNFNHVMAKLLPIKLTNIR